jgi:hypothetical protein
MKKILTLFLSTLLLGGVGSAHAGGGTEYVDGYGWANSRVVAACLITVGAQHTDHLQDAQWDEWVACMAFNASKRRR